MKTISYKIKWAKHEFIHIISYCDIIYGYYNYQISTIYIHQADNTECQIESFRSKVASLYNAIIAHIPDSPSRDFKIPIYITALA